MGDWIVGLQKAAAEPRPGVAAAVLERLELELGRPLPPPLRLLYAQMDGADFDSDVTVFRVEQVGGLREHSQATVSGLPDGQMWCFGARGSEEILFAAPRGPLSALAELPAWITEQPADSWVYGIRNSETGALKVYRSLEKLLWNLVPPAEVEEFGENTFVRALNAVGRALDALETSQAGAASAENAPRVPRKKKRPSAKKKVVAASRKLATSKALAKKAKKQPKKQPRKKVRGRR